MKYIVHFYKKINKNAMTQNSFGRFCPLKQWTESSKFLGHCLFMYLLIKTDFISLFIHVSFSSVFKAPKSHPSSYHIVSSNYHHNWTRFWWAPRVWVSEGMVCNNNKKKTMPVDPSLNGSWFWRKVWPHVWPDWF